MYVLNKTTADFNQSLAKMYDQIKKMKLKQCITEDKTKNITAINKIVKKYITKRKTGTNSIFFDLDDNTWWTIDDLTINQIIIKDNYIQICDNEYWKVILIQ